MCSPLYISQTDLDTILSHAAAESPHEVCGLLAGVGGAVRQVYAISNVASNPLIQFRMDPREQIAALIDIYRNGWDLVAVYHSHPPEVNLEPSPTDIMENTYPGALVLIVQVGMKASGARVGAFCVKHQIVTPVDVVVTS